MRQDHPDPGAAGRNHSLSQDPICQPFRRHHRHPGRIRREQISRPGVGAVFLRGRRGGAAAQRDGAVFPLSPVRGGQRQPGRSSASSPKSINPAPTPRRRRLGCGWRGARQCFMSAPPAGTASGGSSNICGRRGTFCRGTTREPGEPGRRPGSFFLPSSIYTTEMQTTHADFTSLSRETPA